MDDGTGQAFNYVLAAAVVSGALQTLLGIFKLGRIADIFHGSVIQGLLAAIGIIIFAKQIHVALGTHSEGANIVDNLDGCSGNATTCQSFCGIDIIGGTIDDFVQQQDYQQVLSTSYQYLCG